jgi:hypothetical protein
MLKGMNLTDEQVSAIIDAHQETVGALKDKRDEYKADAEKLAAVQKKLDGYEKGTEFVRKEDYDKLEKSFNDYKAEVAGKETLATKQAAYRKLLTEEKIPEKFHARILKMTDFDGIEMDGENIKGADKQRENIKSEWGEYVATTQVKGSNPETPPAGSGTMTKKDILAIKDTGERQKAIAEHLDLFQ